MTVKNVRAWKEESSTQYLRLRNGSDGTVYVVICNERGMTLDGGHLMTIGPKGFYLVKDVKAQCEVVLDGRGRLMQREIAPDVL